MPLYDSLISLSEPQFKALPCGRNLLEISSSKYKSRSESACARALRVSAAALNIGGLPGALAERAAVITSLFGPTVAGRVSTFFTFCHTTSERLTPVAAKYHIETATRCTAASTLR
jgi:hypothetical protein